MQTVQVSESKKNKEVVRMIVHIPNKLKTDFYVKCVKNRTTMAAKIRDLVAAYTKGN